MDTIEIGLWVTAGMLVMVVLGMRVAFAAGLAGLVGLGIVVYFATAQVIGAVKLAEFGRALRRKG